MYYLMREPYRGVHRRTGGLEIRKDLARVIGVVHRRTGGLEIVRVSAYLKWYVHRIIGGLEM